MRKILCRSCKTIFEVNRDLDLKDVMCCKCGKGVLDD